MKTTTNAGKNQENCSRNLNRKCRSHLNHNLFSEHFIYDLSQVFLSQGGQYNDNEKRFQKETKLQKKIYLKLRKLVLSKL